MSDSIIVRRMYKYRLYRADKKDRKLRHKLFVASTVWNHMLALQKRYYRLTGKYITLHQMNKHVLKLRHTERFALWRELHSQVCQDVCRRIDDAYQRFFNKLAKRPPKFKKARRYSSFTFPQSGYKVDGSTVTIDGVKYKFVKHREIGGHIKTLTVKRDPVGRLWLVFSVVEELQVEQSSTGQSGGFDFGLKTFLTDDKGRSYGNPQFFAQSVRKTRKLNRQLARKVEGSKQRKRAKRALAKHHADVANARRDFHFKLAHRLCDAYDVLCVEDLNLQGMKTMWGRKVSDLGFASFMSILEWVAFKRGKRVVKVDCFLPTTKTCSGCGQKHALTLRDRLLVCDCGLTIDRDHNAAINILSAGQTKSAGASALYRSERKTQGERRSPVRLRSRVEGRSLRL
jgi:putative transposase